MDVKKGDYHFLSDKLVFKPVTMKEWGDFQKFFTGNHQFSGCWCMYWRLKRKEFQKQYGEANKRAMKKIIKSGEVPGILAYFEGRPVGWCSVAPREAFPVLDRSPKLKRIDDKPVWSIVCFFVSKPFRRKGVTKALTQAAIKYAKGKGAKIIEAYPIIPENSKNPVLEMYTGIITTFKKLGFKEVIRRSKIRPITRYYI